MIVTPDSDQGDNDSPFDIDLSDNSILSGQVRWLTSVPNKGSGFSTFVVLYMYTDYYGHMS